MKPIIGIVPLWDLTKESYWMLPNYMKGIEEAGGIPVMLPLTSDEDMIQQIVAKFDGFLFSGGPDMDPKYYNEEKLPECGEICPARDTMELLLFKEVFKADKPMLGICRGLQTINIALGGTLYQDLPSQCNITAVHRMEAPYNRAIHNIRILPDTPFAEWIPCKELGVNSCHHQAVKDLALGLTVAAVSEDDVVEAIYMADKRFLAATQWHPEMALDADMYSSNIFDAFISACK